MACESLWVDEGASWGVARRGGTQLLLALKADPSMPLYFVLLHFWMLLGTSEAFIRSLSAIFAVASVPLLYLVARRLAGVTAAAIATVLLAINQFQIAFAQEARGYALTEFLVILSTYLAVRIIDSPSRRVWLGYLAVTLLAVASHAFALFVLAAQLLTFVVAGRVSWKRIAVIVGVGLAALLVLVFGPLGAVMRHNRFNWIARVGPAQALGPIGALTGQGRHWFVLPYLLVALAGVWVLAGRLRRRDERWKPAMLLSWLAVPIVGSLVASIAVPMFVSRYLIVAVPALVVIVATGLASLRRPWLFVPLTVLLLFIGTAALNVYYKTPQKEQWRIATASILARAEPGDEIILYHPNAANPYAYYVARDGGAHTAPHMLWPVDDVRDRRFLRVPIDPLIDDLPHKHRRLWLVFAYEFIHEGTALTAADIQETIDQSMHVVDLRRFPGGIRVWLYEPGPPSA